MAKNTITDWIALTAHELAESTGEAADLMSRWSWVTLREARHKQGDLLESGLLEPSRVGIRLSRKGREKLEGYVCQIGSCPSQEPK